MEEKWKHREEKKKQKGMGYCPFLVLCRDQEFRLSITTENSSSLLQERNLCRDRDLRHCVATGSPGCAHDTAWMRAVGVHVRQSRARVATWPFVSQHCLQVGWMAWVATEFFSVVTGLIWPYVATRFDVATQFG